MLLNRTSRDSALPRARLLGNAERATHLKGECRSVQRQHQEWRPARSVQSIHDIRQDGESQPVEQDQHDRSFDAVKYLNYDSIKSIIFTKLESSTSQERVHITYKMDSRSDCNLMPFKIFKTVFP